MANRNIDLQAKKLFLETLNKIKGESLIDLLNSLMSSAEIKDMARRILASKLLKEGITYSEISYIMGMSESTVNKIHFKTKGSPIINKLFHKD